MTILNPYSLNCAHMATTLEKVIKGYLQCVCQTRTGESAWAICAFQHFSINKTFFWGYGSSRLVQTLQLSA